MFYYSVLKMKHKPEITFILHKSTKTWHLNAYYLLARTKKTEHMVYTTLLYLDVTFTWGKITRKEIYESWTFDNSHRVGL